jgi:hypothetical protein
MMMARTPTEILDAARRRNPRPYRDEHVASLVRAVIATSAGVLDKRTPAAKYARRWNDGDADLILRAAVSPTTIGSAGPLAHVIISFLETLTPMSAGADLLSRGISLSFDGAAQIAMPAIGIPTGGFVAEGAPIPALTSLTTPGPTLTPHKLATIMSLTGELVRSSNAETLVKQVLIESVGPTIDKQLFSANAAGAGPAGLLAGISGLTPASAGTKSEIIIDDVQKLVLSVAPVAGNGNFVLVASPDAAAALALRLYNSVGWPILTSAALAPRTVIVVALNAVVVAIEGAPTIEASTQTEFHRDSVPLEIVTAGGVVATNVGSMYQTDAVALKLRWPISWALRDARGLAYLQNVNW